FVLRVPDRIYVRYKNVIGSVPAAGTTSPAESPVVARRIRGTRRNPSAALAYNLIWSSRLEAVASRQMRSQLIYVAMREIYPRGATTATGLSPYTRGGELDWKVALCYPDSGKLPRRRYDYLARCVVCEIETLYPDANRWPGA